MKRRYRIRDLPGPYWKNIGVGMEVEADNPEGSRWRWRTFFTFDGRGSPIVYSEGGGTTHPGPHEVCGVEKNQGAAWERAREAADDARARYAAEQIRRGQKHAEQIPL